jgi:single-stranded-DNA-specific exonuclease
MSLKNENIPELEAALNDNCGLTDEDFDEKIIIDKELHIGDITYTLAKELSVLSPFGKGNREPLFGSKRVKPDELKIYAEKNVIRFTFAIPDSHRKLTGVCFGRLEEFYEMLGSHYDESAVRKIMSGVLREADLFLDILYTIEIDEYNNNVSVAIKIKYFRIGE